MNKQSARHVFFQVPKRRPEMYHHFRLLFEYRKSLLIGVVKVPITDKGGQGEWSGHYNELLALYFEMKTHIFQASEYFRKIQIPPDLAAESFRFGLSLVSDVYIIPP